MLLALRLLLTELLRSDQPAVQEAAASALYHLTAGSEEHIDAVIANRLCATACHTVKV